MWFYKHMKREEVKDEPQGGGDKTPPKEEPKDDGPKLDDNGYAIVDKEPDPDDKKPPEEEKKPPAEDEDKDKKITSGYDEEGEVEEVEPKKPDPDPETDPDDESQEEIELDIETLEEEDVADILEFIKTHDVSTEAAQALVDIKKKEIAAIVQYDADAATEAENAPKRIEAEWTKELKNDPDFGGAKFKESLHQSEKVINDFFPTMKKQLTERGGMLPPYIMKDLAKLANHLYSPGKLVQGDPTVPPKAEEEDDDPLAFYNS
jgi:hypothetical protein